MLVIEGIGTWILALPQQYLGDQYLKYLAWAQSDKAPAVRAAAVAALLRLYSVDDNLLQMAAFTGR
jgi:cohesin complex subunit SA-1/2